MADQIVALDLGTTHIRGIEARVQKGKLPVIIKTHAVPLDTQLIASGLITNEEILVEAIKRLWKEAKFTSKKVYGMASGEAYDNQVIEEIPWSPDDDFKRMLPYHIRDNFAYDIADYYFDSYTLNEYYKLDSPDPQRYKKILAIGVAKKFADVFIQTVEKAGLIPIGIDIMPFTLIRAYYAAPREDEVPTNAIVISIEIGGDVTTIVIHQNAQPIYVNTATPLGGERITDAIAKDLQLTENEADMVKRSFGMSDEEKLTAEASTIFEDGSTRRTQFMAIPTYVIQEAQSIIAREVSNIIGHVNDILEDAFSTHAGRPFEIVLSGGTAELATLKERMQSELQIPVSILQPFSNGNKKLEPSVLAHQSGYVSIYGLLVGLQSE